MKYLLLVCAIFLTACTTGVIDGNPGEWYYMSSGTKYWTVTKVQSNIFMIIDNYPNSNTSTPGYNVYRAEAWLNASGCDIIDRERSWFGGQERVTVSKECYPVSGR